MTFSTLLIASAFLPFFEAKNTVANYVIAPPTGTPVKVEKPTITISGPCETCDGKGELVLVEPDFGQLKGRMGSTRKQKEKCPICGGNGRRQGFIDPAALSLAVSADINEYQARHQSKGEIAVGRAFVPNDVYQTLDKNRIKLVQEAYGEPCPKCTWTGLEACKKCRGKGTVPCTYDDCKGGWGVTKTTTKFQSTKSGSSFGGNSGCRSYGNRSSGRRISRVEEKITVTICPECHGAKIIKCPECLGRGAHPCKKCGGLGMKVKR